MLTLFSPAIRGQPAVGLLMIREYSGQNTYTRCGPYDQVRCSRIAEPSEST
jgi:hypothetical protein